MVQKWVRNPSRAQKEKQPKGIFNHLNTVHVIKKKYKNISNWIAKHRGYS